MAVVMVMAEVVDIVEVVAIMAEVGDMEAETITLVLDMAEDPVMEEEDMVVEVTVAEAMMITREVWCPMEVTRVRRSVQNLQDPLDPRAPTTDVRRPKRHCS